MSKRNTKTVDLNVAVDTRELEKKVKRLIHKLKKANSLANELAITLRNLEIDIKV